MSWTTELPPDLAQWFRRNAQDIEILVRWFEDQYAVWEDEVELPDDMEPYNVEVSVFARVPWGAQAMGQEVLGGVWSTDPGSDRDIHGYLPQMLHEALVVLANELEEHLLPARRVGGAGMGWPTGTPDAVIQEVADARDQAIAAIDFLATYMAEEYEEQMRQQRREQMLEDVKKGVRKPRGGGGRFQSLELFEDEPVVLPPRPASGRFKRLLENPGGVSKTELNRAVTQMRLYLGSVDYASVKVQQKLYEKAMRVVSSIADKTGMSLEEVWRQVEQQARHEGVKRPQPGKDF